MDSFGERLEHALRIRKLTSAQLARAADVAPSAVSTWLAGSRPSRRNVAEVARLLEVSVGWLEHGEGQAPVDVVAVAEEMAHLFWWFRPQSPDGQRILGEPGSTGFDPTVGIITREAGQNIRDARRPGEKTVKAGFRVERLRGEALDSFLSAIRFDELRPHLKAAAVGKGKQSTVLRHALERLDNKRELILLRIDDLDGIGLLGAEFGDSNYSALVRNVMDTNKPVDAGGSHGLGKATLQRASSFGVVLFNSNLTEPESSRTDRNGRLVGRISLPWHATTGSPGNPSGEWAGPGWFGVPDTSPGRDGTARSVYASEPLQREMRLARPDATGTSILIVGAHDPSGEIEDPVEVAREISTALSENFFAALVPQDEEPPIMGAVVSVVDVASDGSEKTLHEDVVDPSDRMRPLVDLLEKGRAMLTVPELQAPGDVFRTTVKLQVPRRTEAPEHGPLPHEAVLLVRLASANEFDHPFCNTVILMRGALMRVEILRPRSLGAGVRPYFAVLLAGEAAKTDTNDKAAEVFLRTAEPPSHEAWKVTPDLGATYQSRGAKKMLDDFRTAILQALRAAVTVPLREPSDGPESLRELLRIRKPPEPTQRPRVIAPVKGAPRSDGAWEITEVTVQLPPQSKAWAFDPVLRFGGETGGGIQVKWAEVQAIVGCTVENGRIKVPAGVRKARWRGVTDPASHPVAAADAVAQIDIRRVIEEDA